MSLKRSSPIFHHYYYTIPIPLPAGKCNWVYFVEKYPEAGKKLIKLFRLVQEQQLEGPDLNLYLWSPKRTHPFYHVIGQDVSDFQAHIAVFNGLIHQPYDLGTGSMTLRTVLQVFSSLKYQTVSNTYA